MPYPTPEDRAAIDDGWLKVAKPGHLNYVITQAVRQYLADISAGVPGYSHFNEVIGVLESVKIELYRRVIAIYEDQKAAQNGDTFAGPAPKAYLPGYRAPQ